MDATIKRRENISDRRFLSVSEHGRVHWWCLGVKGRNRCGVHQWECAGTTPIMAYPTYATNGRPARHKTLLSPAPVAPGRFNRRQNSRF